MLDLIQVKVKMSESIHWEKNSNRVNERGRKNVYYSEFPRQDEEEVNKSSRKFDEYGFEDFDCSEEEDYFEEETEVDLYPPIYEPKNSFNDDQPLNKNNFVLAYWKEKLEEKNIRENTQNEPQKQQTNCSPQQKAPRANPKINFTTRDNSKKVFRADETYIIDIDAILRQTATIISRIIDKCNKIPSQRFIQSLTENLLKDFIDIAQKKGRLSVLFLNNAIKEWEQFNFSKIIKNPLDDLQLKRLTYLKYNILAVREKLRLLLNKNNQLVEVIDKSFEIKKNMVFLSTTNFSTSKKMITKLLMDNIEVFSFSNISCHEGGFQSTRYFSQYPNLLIGQPTRIENDLIPIENIINISADDIMELLKCGEEKEEVILFLRVLFSFLSKKYANSNLSALLNDHFHFISINLCGFFQFQNEEEITELDELDEFEANDLFLQFQQFIFPAFIAENYINWRVITCNPFPLAELITNDKKIYHIKGISQKSLNIVVNLFNFNDNFINLEIKNDEIITTTQGEIIENEQDFKSDKIIMKKENEEQSSGIKPSIDAISEFIGELPQYNYPENNKLTTVEANYHYQSNRPTENYSESINYDKYIPPQLRGYTELSNSIIIPKDFVFISKDWMKKVFKYLECNGVSEALTVLRSNEVREEIPLLLEFLFKLLDVKEYSLEVEEELLKFAIFQCWPLYLSSEIAQKYYKQLYTKWVKSYSPDPSIVIMINRWLKEVNNKSNREYTKDLANYIREILKTDENNRNKYENQITWETSRIFKMGNSNEIVEKFTNPLSENYRFDGWQKKVIDVFEQDKGSALVSAPTGSGKTFLTYELIYRFLNKNETGHLVYISPTIPLAKMVYIELLKFLKLESVGMLTKYRRTFKEENRPPQIIITTPEFFEVLLLSPSFNKIYENIKLLIFDEIHLLADQQRGSSIEHIFHFISCNFFGFSATLSDTNKNFLHWLKKFTPNNEIEDIKHDQRATDLIPYVGLDLTPFHPWCFATDSLIDSKIQELLPQHICITIQQLANLNMCSELLNYWKKDFPTKFKATKDENETGYILLALIIQHYRQIKNIKNSFPLTRKDIFYCSKKLRELVQKSSQKETLIKNIKGKVVNAWDYIYKISKFNAEDISKEFIKLFDKLEQRNMFPALFIIIQKSWQREIFKYLIKHWSLPKVNDPDITNSIQSFAKLSTDIEINYEKRKLLILGLENGIALHNATLPKEYIDIVEKLVFKGKLKMVISSTALGTGIHTPCKTVVFAAESKLVLNEISINQMTGRAGRRGIEDVGNIIYFCSNERRIKDLISTPIPEIKGSIEITYSFILRLIVLLKSKEYPNISSDLVGKVSRILRDKYSFNIENLEETMKQIVRIFLRIYQKFEVVDKEFFPCNFAHILTNMYYIEPSNLLLVYYLNNQLLYADRSDPTAIKKIIIQLFLIYSFSNSSYVVHCKKRKVPSEYNSNTTQGMNNNEIPIEINENTKDDNKPDDKSVMKNPQKKVLNLTDIKKKNSKHSVSDQPFSWSKRNSKKTFDDSPPYSPPALDPSVPSITSFIDNSYVSNLYDITEKYNNSITEIFSQYANEINIGSSSPCFPLSSSDKYLCDSSLYLSSVSLLFNQRNKHKINNNMHYFPQLISRDFMEVFKRLPFINMFKEVCLFYYFFFIII